MKALAVAISLSAHLGLRLKSMFSVSFEMCSMSSSSSIIPESVPGFLKTSSGCNINIGVYQSSDGWYGYIPFCQTQLLLSLEIWNSVVSAALFH